MHRFSGSISAVATREELQKERRLSAAEMDQVIERASLLQERAELGDGKHSVEAVKDVGKELDLQPGYIDAAVAELEQEKQRQAQAAAAQRASLRKGLIGLGIAVVLTLGGGWIGSGSVRDAAGVARGAEVGLNTVLRRQVALVPQMLALSGGDIASLQGAREALENATTLEERLKAADALRLEMAQVMGQLPPALSSVEADRRTALQNEVVGAENRIAVERRRYEEALVAWRTAGSGPLARIGLALGLAPEPPPVR